jgi:hypothetical protein
MAKYTEKAIRRKLQATQMKLGRQFPHEDETLADAKMQLNSTLRRENAPVELELDPSEQFKRVAEEMKLNAAACTTEAEARAMLKRTQELLAAQSQPRVKRSVKKPVKS